jgi:hypothetical protein
MTNIFMDIPILLEYRSQVEKDVFLMYHLTIESNIPLLLCGSIEITLHVLRFRPTVIPYFYAKIEYSSYVCPRINCSTHTAKSVHR